MYDKKVKEILKFLNETNDVVIIKEITSLIKKEPRYTQAFLDALEGVGLIILKSKGTMKMVFITEKGREFLNKKD